MNQPGRIQFRINKTGLILVAVLSILIIPFFTIDCEGQEEANQSLSPEEYAKSLKYETPGILNANDILPSDLISTNGKQYFNCFPFSSHGNGTTSLFV